MPDSVRLFGAAQTTSGSLTAKLLDRSQESVDTMLLQLSRIQPSRWNAWSWALTPQRCSLSHVWLRRMFGRRLLIYALLLGISELEDAVPLRVKTPSTLLRPLVRWQISWGVPALTITRSRRERRKSPFRQALL